MLTVAAFAMSIGLVVAACSSGNKVAASASGGGTQTGASKPIVVIMSNPRYGQILTTAAGFALYTYTADEPGGAGCDAACLKIWPPLLLPAGDTAPVPGPGVTGLGTLQRGNQLQVTWNGLPLYLFVTDKQPGQVTGQNVVDRAGKWILATVAASTEAPGTTAPASPAGSPSSTRPPATSRKYGEVHPNPQYAISRIQSVTRVGLPVEWMTDDALLAGFSAGGPDVQLAFVRRFQAHVYAVALAVVGDAVLAEDVAQQAFIRAWKRSSTFDSRRGTVRGWLTTVTRNAAVDMLRVRKPDPVDPTDLIRLLGPVQDGPGEVAIRNEAHAHLRSCIRQLPPEQARALVMAGMYRMTAQEVADAEGIPLGTAKTRIRTAMTRLRERLSSPEVAHD